jgi:uncharacterized protein YbjT (DUF2867 family)
MAEAKVIAVTGATGAQGGGLVRAILADPGGGFRARAITRDPGSEKARALAELGAEVVAGDVDDAGSVERAFAGAHGAFCVTFFWEHFSPDKELQQARNLAAACRAAGVRHAIWSTLEDTRKSIPLDDDRMPTLQGRYKVPHFDAKAEGDEAFRASGVPTTCLVTSFYWENLIYFGMNPKPGADGVLELVIPMGDARLAGMAAEDIGRCAYAVFKRGAEFHGKTVGIAGEFLSGAEMASKLARALGRPVRHVSPSFEQYRAFGFPGADDLGNMFQYDAECSKEALGMRDLAKARELNPALQTFDDWLARNASKIPLQ